MSIIELVLSISCLWIVPVLYIVDRVDIISIQRRGKLLLLGLSLAVILTAVFTLLLDLPRILLAALTSILAQFVTYVLLEKLFTFLKRRPPRPVYGQESEVIELADRIFGFSFLVLSIAVGCATVIALMQSTGHVIDTGYPAVTPQIAVLLIGPVILLHTFAKANVVLRRPLLTAFKWTLPLVVALSSIVVTVDWKFLPLAAALLAPHIQWLVVFMLYSRFEKTYGRDPRDVFMRTGEVPDPGPDASLLWVGLVALTVLPAGFVLIAARLAAQLN